MSNVSDWPPMQRVILKSSSCGLSEMVKQSRLQMIERTISQPHWRPALTILAMAIRRVNRTYQPKTRRNDQ